MIKNVYFISHYFKHISDFFLQLSAVEGFFKSYDVMTFSFFQMSHATCLDRAFCYLKIMRSRFL